MKDVYAVFDLAAALMPLWPRPDPTEIQEAGRIQKARATALRGDERHQWVWAAQRWQCVFCAAIATTPDAKHRRSKELCKSECSKITEVLTNPRGHKLAAGDIDGAPLIFCETCGAWATSRPIKLLAPCEPRTKWGSECLRQIAAGHTPVKDGQRMQIYATWRIGEREPFEVEAPPADLNPVELTAADTQEESFRTWSRSWRAEEQARPRRKTEELLLQL